MHQLIVYVPESHVEAVKKALFEAGAGHYAKYDSCAWQVKGQGQFRPLLGSKPYLGQSMQIETVEEYRIEMICVEEKLSAAITALKKSHPYEEPAYSVFKMVKID